MSLKVTPPEKTHEPKLPEPLWQFIDFTACFALFIGFWTTAVAFIALMLTLAIIVPGWTWAYIFTRAWLIAGIWFLPYSLIQSIRFAHDQAVKRNPAARLRQMIDQLGRQRSLR